MDLVIIRKYGGRQNQSLLTMYLRLNDSASHFLACHLSAVPRLLCKLMVNTLRPRQNGRHFPDDIFIWILLNENVWISISTSLKFVPRGQINNIPTSVQVMAWRRQGDKPLSKPMMVRLPTHIWVTRPQWVNMTTNNACYYDITSITRAHMTCCCLHHSDHKSLEERLQTRKCTLVSQVRLPGYLVGQYKITTARHRPRVAKKSPVKLIHAGATYPGVGDVSSKLKRWK